ncbi:Hypothetical protein FKW44_008114, partial [Caligus rogercresseyi]
SKGLPVKPLACSGGQPPISALSLSMGFLELPQEIGCRERLPLGISVEGNPSPSLYTAPVVKNLPRKAHKDP